MATVHLGRLMGPVGFSRTVAIKRLHEHFSKDPDFVSMFLDEARLCARIRHPNVVPTLDVIAEDRQLLLVMEYVQGESLARLQRTAVAKNDRIPLNVAVAILSGMLHGLHAAHEAKDERGQPLGIVHRDVSPQNVVVGADGVARVLDFGIAKAKGRLYTTQDGRVKGKLSYMAPEQLRSEPVDRRTDIFAASVMAWELLTGKRLFESTSEGGTITKVLLDPIPMPSAALAEGLAGASVASLDAIVMRGLQRDPADRFQTARELADELEAAVQPATTAQVGSWVESVAAEALHERTARVQEIESGTTDTRQHIDAAIAKLTSEPDVSHHLDSSSDATTMVEGIPSTQELLSKGDMSLSRSQVPVAPSRDPWPRRAVFALVFVGLAVAALVAQMGRDRTQRESTREPISSATGPSTGAPGPSAPPPPDTAAAGGSSSASPEPPSTAGSPSSTASARVAPTPSASSKPEPPHGTGPKPPVDCRDPYTRDSLGRKIYKLECL
jgi:serine/threonine-protein kinase